MPRGGRKTLDSKTGSGNTILVSGTTSGTPNTVTTHAHGQDLSGLSTAEARAWGKHSLKAVNTSTAASAVGTASVVITDCDGTNVSVASAVASVPFDIVFA